MLFTRYIPTITLSIGIIALTFQMSILYPWHIELKNEMQEMIALKNKQEQDLEDYTRNQLKRIEEVQIKLDALIMAQEERMKNLNSRKLE